MTTETDKLVEMAQAAGFTVYNGTIYCHDSNVTERLAAFASAHIASLCGDVEQDGFRLVSVNAGFTELLEALDRADRKGYMPDAIYSAYEGFECRDPASTVAALKAERDAALARATDWQRLYDRAINEANGLTNYVEDRPELRSAERRLDVIAADARALKGQP